MSKIRANSTGKTELPFDDYVLTKLGATFDAGPFWIHICRNNPPGELTIDISREHSAPIVTIRLKE